MIQRIAMYRSDEDQVVEEATEIIEHQIMPGPTTFSVHATVGVRTPQGMMPVQVRVPCPPGTATVHEAFASIGDALYQERVNAATSKELARRNEAVRRQSLAGQR